MQQSLDDLDRIVILDPSNRAARTQAVITRLRDDIQELDMLGMFIASAHVASAIDILERSQR